MPLRRILLHEDAKEYYSLTDAAKLLKCGSNKEFKSTYMNFRYVALSEMQKNRLVHNGNVPKSYLTRCSYLVLCEDVDSVASRINPEGLSKKAVSHVVPRNTGRQQPETSMDCSFENQGTSSVLSQANETVQKDGGRRYVCESCPFYTDFPNEETFLRHMDVAHPNVIRTTPTIVVSNTNQPPSTGIVISPSPEKIPTPSPNVDSLRPSSSAATVVRTETLLKCKMCFNYFDSFDLLYAHQTRYQHIYSCYHCEICWSTFLSESELNQHIQANHPSAEMEHPQSDARFHCTVDGCRSVFRKGENLVQHAEKFHKKKVFICESCFAMFHYREGLKLHLRLSCPLRKGTTKAEMRSTIELRNATYRCDLCHDGKEFPCPVTFLHHKRLNHPESVTASDAENLLGKGKWKPLVAEPKVQGEMRRFVCRICNRTFRWRSSIRVHELAHVGIGFVRKRTRSSKPHTEKATVSKVCHLCGKVFAKSVGFSAHMDMHNGVQRFHCQKCGKAFGFRNHLRNHQKKPCDRNDYKFTCQICSNVFKTQLSLNTHINTRHSESVAAEKGANAAAPNGRRRFQCSKCGKFFLSKSGFFEHTQKPCSRSDYKFSCKVCLNVFKTKNSLNIHTAKFHPVDESSSRNETPRFQCTNCSKFFARKSGLAEHKKHPCSVSDYQYRCHICSNVFKAKQSLTTHLAKFHSNELRPRKLGAYKKFLCEICGRGYSWWRAFKAHKAMHAGWQYPRFSCSNCGKFFVRKVGLTIHQSKPCSVDDYAYRCRICNNAFKTKRSLGHHMATLHYEQPSSSTVAAEAQQQVLNAAPVEAGEPWRLDNMANLLVWESP